MNAPLLWTTFRWANQRNPAGKFSKVPLMRKGFEYKDFAYGSDTAEQWRPFNPADPPGGIQMALICSPQTRLLVVDVDNQEKYAQTEIGAILGRDDAMSTRGDHYHIGINMTGIHPARWPRQGAVSGADIKNGGFVPVPGCMHYSGELYEPRYDPDGGPALVTVTEEILGAIQRTRGAYYSASRPRADGPGGNSVNGMDHDTYRAGLMLSYVLDGTVSPAEIRAAWDAAPDHNSQCSSSQGFTQADFERHYHGAQRKAARIKAEEATWWKGMMSRAERP